MCYVNYIPDLVYRYVHFDKCVSVKRECVLIPEMRMRNLKLDETRMLLTHCVILMSVAIPFRDTIIPNYVRLPSRFQIIIQPSAHICYINFILLPVI